MCITGRFKLTAIQFLDPAAVMVTLTPKDSWSIVYVPDSAKVSYIRYTNFTKI
jgi:hypothetical protein